MRMNWKYGKAMLFGFMCVFGCVLVGVLINTQALRLDGKGSMEKDVDASADVVKGDCLNTTAEAAHTQILFNNYINNICLVDSYY